MGLTGLTHLVRSSWCIETTGVYQNLTCQRIAVWVQKKSAKVFQLLQNIFLRTDLMNTKMLYSVASKTNSRPNFSDLKDLTSQIYPD